jgi:Flp pilus assembly protein TadD
LRKGNYVAAATNFNKARQINSSNAIAIAGLGEIALQQSQYGGAIKHLSRAVRLRRSARTYTLLGEAYLGAGQNAKAAKAFKTALKLNPDNPRAANGYNEATGGN